MRYTSVLLIAAVDICTAAVVLGMDDGGAVRSRKQGFNIDSTDESDLPL